MKVWYCYQRDEHYGWLIASPTRGKAKTLAVDFMLLDFDGGFMEMRTRVWPKEIESVEPRALTSEECEALGLRMLEDWEL